MPRQAVGSQVDLRLTIDDLFLGAFCGQKNPRLSASIGGFKVIHSMEPQTPS
jgi:hypothetical protein